MQKKSVPYLLSKLEMLSDLPIVGDVRGKGLMLAVELIETDDRAPRNSKDEPNCRTIARRRHYRREDRSCH